MKTAVNNFIIVFFVLVFGALTVGCEVARWNECRRIHPVWYCLGAK